MDEVADALGRPGVLSVFLQVGQVVLGQSDYQSVVRLVLQVGVQQEVEFEVLGLVPGVP